MYKKNLIVANSLWTERFSFCVDNNLHKDKINANDFLISKKKKKQWIVSSKFIAKNKKKIISKSEWAHLTTVKCTYLHLHSSNCWWNCFRHNRLRCYFRPVELLLFSCCFRQIRCHNHMSMKLEQKIIEWNIVLPSIKACDHLFSQAIMCYIRMGFFFRCFLHST